jgi:hypothetical protein
MAAGSFPLRQYRIAWRAAWEAEILAPQPAQRGPREGARAHGGGRRGGSAGRAAGRGGRLFLTPSLPPPFIYVSGVLPEKARLDSAGATKVNSRETCVM